VQFRAQGGLTIHRLAISPRLCRFPTTQWMCFLQIGGNDATMRSAEELTQDIVSYVNYLLTSQGVTCVVIRQLLRRDPYKSPMDYNKVFNRCLEQLTSATNNIFFWKHKGFWPDLQHLGPDGVYLSVTSTGNSPAPMLKYLRSVRYVRLILGELSALISKTEGQDSWH
jgi:hypothetical protein